MNSYFNNGGHRVSKNDKKRSPEDNPFNQPHVLGIMTIQYFSIELMNSEKNQHFNMQLQLDTEQQSLINKIWVTSEQNYHPSVL